MSRLVDSEQAKLIDTQSQEFIALRENLDLQECGNLLMEEAGEKMAHLLAEALEKRERTQGKSIRNLLIICGPGNNGGDALVVARLLLENKNLRFEKMQVACSSERVSNSNHRQLLKFKNVATGNPRVDFRSYQSIEKTQLIVDGIFGVGLDREISGDYARLIRWVNQQKDTYVISLDTPSGLNVSTGQVWGVAIKANETLSVYPRKLGFYLRKGVPLRGRVKDVHISFPQHIVEAVATRYFLLNKKNVTTWLPKRDPTFNKSNFGRSYVVAGSKGKWGAAVLALRSAFRVGSGYVYHVQDEASQQVLGVTPEAMHAPISDLKKLILEKPGALLFGPGMGMKADILELINYFSTQSHPAVVDADAITLLAQHSPRIFPFNFIFTPHSAELSRLIHWTSDEVDINPIGALKLAQKHWGGSWVLKGLHSVFMSGESQRCVVVPKGNVALAKAGTGDVLSGMIVGFLAQSIHPTKATLMALYLHGAVADNWERRESTRSLLASDLVELLPRTIKALESVYQS